MGYPCARGHTLFLGLNRKEMKIILYFVLIRIGCSEWWIGVIIVIFIWIHIGCFGWLVVVSGMYSIMHDIVCTLMHTPECPCWTSNLITKKSNNMD